MTNKNQVILDVDIDKKDKMKVRHIIIEGNDNLKSSKIKIKLFAKGVFRRHTRAVS